MTPSTSPTGMTADSRTLAMVAAELGTTVVRLVAVVHASVPSIISAEQGELRLGAEQVIEIRDAWYRATASASISGESRPVRRKPRPARSRRARRKAITVGEFAEAYGISSDRVLELCATHGFVLTSADARLSIGQENRLVLELEPRGEPDDLPTMSTSATTALASVLANATTVERRPRRRDRRERPHDETVGLVAVAEEWGVSVDELVETSTLLGLWMRERGKPAIRASDRGKLRRGLDARREYQRRWGAAPHVRLTKVAKGLGRSLPTVRGACERLSMSVRDRGSLTMAETVLLMATVADGAPPSVAERDSMSEGIYSDPSMVPTCLAGLVLVGQDFSGELLRGVDFSGADLTRAVFDGADLTGAIFSGAVLRHASFCSADLTGACLDGADLRGADLSEAKGC